MPDGEAPVPLPSLRGGVWPAPDPRAEAVLYVQWVRGAIGRSMAGEDLAASAPTPAAGARWAPGPDRAASALPEASDPVATAPVPLAEVRPPVRGEPTRVPTAVGDAGAAGGLDDLDGLDGLARDAATCTRCRLATTRRCVVFGEGPARPRLLVIGEAPGAEEDATGRPFVGAAGQLLDRMLGAVGLARADVYIANVVKCRPPGNRPPSPDEMGACRPYLDAQMEALRPDLVLLLGTVATRAVLGTERGITALRGQLLRTPSGLPALPTYHPAYLLRNPAAKREAWTDLQRLASVLGLALPPRDASA